MSRIILATISTTQENK
ncbi:hypothetical protein NXZ18_23760 [Escherichia coli]|nr:hypothetical protein [Escherichia coli]